jgi:hypothetical protein
MLIWLMWALLLIAQNAAFTWVSRARNSGSLSYHALASVFSNGIWIFSQAIIINFMISAINSGDWSKIAFTGLYYTGFTVTGSVSMHAFLRAKVEKGSRRVGAYAAGTQAPDASEDK